MKLSSIATLTSGLFVASALSAHALTAPSPSLSMSVVWADCDPAQNSAAPYAVTCGANPDANGMNRTDSGNVNLGAADGQFYSLGLASPSLKPQGPFQGLGGSIVFEISPAFTGPAMVFEVTNPSNHWEAAEVYVGNSESDFQLVGTVTNGKGGSEAAINTVAISGVWKYIGLLDVSVAYYGESGSIDGFDLDAISVTAVPVPAGALLLGTALAGLGFARRKA